MAATAIGYWMVFLPLAPGNLHKHCMKLKDAYQRFLRDNDEAALLAAIGALPRHLLSKDVEYPEVHRICDIRLLGKTFRVCRLVDVEDGEVRVFIEPTSFASDEPGVPYWLQGERLLEWIREETECTSKGPSDWDAYR